MKRKLFFSGVIVVIAFVIGAYAYQMPKAASAEYDAFAKCLADKNVTMYGAAWCSHCQSQKKLFGSSFQYVPYVECPQNNQLCVQKGVKGYPTWILSDGTTLVGEQSLEALSTASACPLPSAVE